MSDVVVFLVKNGIGFGHLRRAFLLADAVAEAGRLQPVVVSQARSLALHQLRDPRVSAINLPLLHRLPSAVTEDCYTDLLDATLRRLGPAVVVEDTYPDSRYGALPTLRDTPRLLVMRRLDGLSFDQLRSSGGFARYGQILVAQDAEALARESHSGDSLAAIQHSDRFTLVGNLAATPTAAQIETVRRTYAPNGERLVVVAAGAGGDQMPDGYTDRLFTACGQVAHRLQTAHPHARFVLVTGPYYAGRPPPDLPNMVVRRFETHLAALLAAAHVAVIKPSNNVLSETLDGPAHLVLVPDMSFMEGLDQHAAHIAADYAGHVARPDADQLEGLVHDALTRPPRQRRLPPNLAGVRRALEAIHHQADLVQYPAAVGPKRLLLVLQPPPGLSPQDLRARLPEPLHAAIPVVTDSAATAGEHVIPLTALDGPPAATPRFEAAVLVDAEPSAGRAPDEVAAHGPALLFTVDGTHRDAVARWLAVRPPRPSLFTADLTRFHASPGNIPAPTRRIAAALDRATWAGLLLDLTALDPEAELHDYLHQLARWLANQPVNLATLAASRQIFARALLEPT